MEERSHRIGHIRLDEVLGEGAMGTVWAGVDEKLRRDVAVKTLRSDRVTAETRARLLIEARILSRLEVPGICRVYDYMEDADNGYLVLERVRGRTLREMIAERPEIEVALDLAEQLAAALAAAHARGVIHRDLKPSNVMLAAREGGGEQVKVLDFGLARAAREGAGERPESSAAPRPRRAEIDGSLTRFGSLIGREDGDGVTGTPAYMSPEQARGEVASAASDMYSYGLVLQELLTGRSAYQQDLSLDRLMARAAAGNTLPAEGVGGELRKLVEDLKAFDPQERPSATAVCHRLRRIRDRPRRLRRRVAVALLISAAVFGAVKYNLDLRHERNLAVAAREEAITAGEEAREVADFLTSLFEASNPYQRGDATVRDFLDRGAAGIERLADRPIVQGRILHTIGTMYSRLAASEEAAIHLVRAVEQRRRVLGERHPDTAATLSELGAVRMYQGDLDAAAAALHEALGIQRQVLGRHPDTAKTLARLGPLVALRDPGAQVALYQEALAIQQESLGEHHVDLAATLGHLAITLLDQGNIVEAERHFRRAIEIQRHLDRHDAVLAVELAKLLTIRGQLEEAEELFRSSLDDTREAWGDRAVPLAVVMARLGDVKREQGKLEEADRLYDQALAIAAEHFSKDHNLFGYFYTKVARLLEAQGNRAAAIAKAEQAVRIMESTVGGAILVEARVHLADLLRQAGDLEKAETVIAQALDLARDRQEESSWRSHAARSVRGAIRSAQGRREEAEPLLLAGLSGLRETCGDRSSWTRRAQARLIEHYQAGGRASPADPHPRPLSQPAPTRPGEGSTNPLVPSPPGGEG